jgi:hypothetical protein
MVKWCLCSGGEPDRGLSYRWSNQRHVLFSRYQHHGGCGEDVRTTWGGRQVLALLFYLADSESEGANYCKRSMIFVSFFESFLRADLYFIWHLWGLRTRHVRIIFWRSAGNHSSSLAIRNGDPDSIFGFFFSFGCNLFHCNFVLIPFHFSLYNC